MAKDDRDVTEKRAATRAFCLVVTVNAKPRMLKCCLVSSRNMRLSVLMAFLRGRSLWLEVGAQAGNQAREVAEARGEGVKEAEGRRRDGEEWEWPSLATMQPGANHESITQGTLQFVCRIVPTWRCTCPSCLLMASETSTDQRGGVGVR